MLRRRRFLRGYLLGRLLIALVLALFIWWWYKAQFGRVFNPFNISFEAFEDLDGE